MEKDIDEKTCKCEEACFIKVKHFSVTKNSKISGYNLYKVAILYQEGVNNIINSFENISGIKSFGGHICGKSAFLHFFVFPVLFLSHFLIKCYIESYIYLGMMNLEYDGIYRYFQLSEIKLAQNLSEFNLIKKLIIKTFYFKVNLSLIILKFWSSHILNPLFFFSTQYQFLF
jgi:hypothetical protein